MKFEDEALLILEAIAKSTTSSRSRKLARSLRHRVSRRVKSLGIRVFEEMTERLPTMPQTQEERSTPRRPQPVSAQETAAQVAAKPHPQASEPTPLISQSKPNQSIPTTPTTHNAKRYGIDRVVLLIRHPDRAFAYWEISEKRVSKSRTGRTGQLELIDAGDNRVLDSVHVDPLQGRHYFQLLAPDRSYRVELKAQIENGEWSSLSCSYPAKYDPENPTGSQPPTRNQL